jgi:hypothetical protein
VALLNTARLMKKLKLNDNAESLYHRFVEIWHSKVLDLFLLELLVTLFIGKPDERKRKQEYGAGAGWSSRVLVVHVEIDGNTFLPVRP